MRESDQPALQSMTAAAVRDSLGELIRQVSRKQARVIVEESGVPVAALVSADDLARLTQLDAQRAEGVRLLQESWDAFKDEPAERVETEVARAVASARTRERRKQARAHAS
jgi:prevent-host-death family protein